MNKNKLVKEVIDHNRILTEKIKENAERVKELETYVETGTYINRKLRKQNRRYREAMEEILENEISCWEIIKNKLTYALYK